MIKNMLTKSDLKAIQELVQDLFNEFKLEIKDNVISRLDKVIGELKTIREEQTVMAGK